MGFESQTKPEKQLYEEQLRSRGFDEDEALGWGLAHVDSSRSAEIFGWNVGPCLRIVYFDEDGQPIPDYMRVRRLNPGKPKYVCPRGSLTQIYYAPHQQVSCRVAQKNVEIKLLITEGEFKAIALSKALKAEGLSGYYVIGLQGVDQFGATDKARLHESLARFRMKERDAFIWYDFDGTSPEGDPKVEVQNAEARLASLLALFGANVLIGRIGRRAKHKEFKYAIDDYLAEGGKLSELLSDETAYTEAVAMTAGSRLQALYEYRSRFALIGGLHVNLETFEQLPLSRQLVQHGHMQFEELVQQGNNMVPKTFQTAAVYGRWVRALRLNGFGFDPHRQGEMITGDMKLNTFKDWEHDPKDGDVDPYLQLLSMLFRDDDLVNYMLDWAAQMFQKPWEKNHTVPMLVGRDEGTGKSLALDTLARIMGVNPGQPGHIGGPEELFSSFNGHLLGKVLFVANEVGTESGKDAKRFKHFVTGSEVLINTKYGAQISVPNYINLGITSNVMNPLKVDGSGRRETIIAVHGTKPRNLVVCQQLVRWLDFEHGHSKLLSYLMNRDISKFDPHVAGPETEAKRLAAEASKTFPEHVADEMMQRMEDWYEGLDWFMLTESALNMFTSETERRKLAIRPGQAMRRRQYIYEGSMPVRLNDKVVRASLILRRDVLHDRDAVDEILGRRHERGYLADRLKRCTESIESGDGGMKARDWELET